MSERFIVACRERDVEKEVVFSQETGILKGSDEQFTFLLTLIGLIFNIMECSNWKIAIAPTFKNLFLFVLSLKSLQHGINHLFAPVCFSGSRNILIDSGRNKHLKNLKNLIILIKFIRYINYWEINISYKYFIYQSMFL